MVRVFLPLVLVLSISPQPLWADEEQDANRLFVESVRLYRSSTGAIDPVRRVNLLSAAWEKLDPVTGKYRNTRIGRELATGKPVGNFSLVNWERDLKMAMELLPESAARKSCPREFSTECLVDWALKIGRGIETANTREWVLEHAARALAGTGRVSDAIDLAHEIDSTLYRGAALGLIATKLANDGNVSKALELAGEIENDDYRSRTLGGISVAQANAGQFDEALDLLSRIGEGNARDHAAGRIASAHAGKGQFRKALDMAGEIKNESIGAWTLGDIAFELSNAGEEEKAAEIFKEASSLAIRAAESGGSKNGLVEVVSSLADAGQFADAVVLAQEIKSEFAAQWALMEIAGSHARINRFDEARRVLSAARDDFFQARGLADIARFQQLAGSRDESAATFTQSLETARGIDEKRLRGWVLGEIAAALVLAGREPEANTVFAEALIVLEADNFELKRALSLVDVLAALAP